MEGWLNLRLFIPSKNLRALVYAHLKAHMGWVRPIVECAHDSAFEITLDRLFARYCARNGHLALLQWMQANGSVSVDVAEVPWDEDEYICVYAARYGHLNVLQWARANKCPLDEYICHYAAKYGHLDVLQWARANGCPWNKTECLWEAKDEIRYWIANN